MRTQLGTGLLIAVTILGASATPVGAGTGRPAVHPDFNGDGFADLAIGVPFERIGGVETGAVHVLYGSGAGLTGARDELWTQDSPGIPDTAEWRDNFGWSVATGDFDGDGYDDLAVGSRRESLGARSAGSVTVIPGSADGLTSAGSRLWHQGLTSVADQAERGDQYGWSLITADFDRDGFDDLAVGVQFENLSCGGGSCEDAGAVNVLYGTPNGIRAARNQLWTQQSPGIPDGTGENDRFGWAMAAEDFDGDGFDDLAVSAPYESYHANRDGLVHIIHGSSGGLTAAGTQVWSQDSPGIAGTAYLREQFGQSLAAGDLDGDGKGDLVVGVWFQDDCWICNEGVAHVIYGTGSGLRAAGSQLWSQDSPGILDHRDVGDQFSQSLAVDDFDGDGIDDLAVGTPWEDFTAYVHEDQGAINVIYGTPDGLRAAGNQLWSQNSAGIQDVAERNDHFAEAIGTGDFDGDGDADLAVGVAWETRNGKRGGAVNVIRGTGAGLRASGNQLWTQDHPALLDAMESTDRFGWSLSSALARSGSPRVCYGDRGGPC